MHSPAGPEFLIGKVEQMADLVEREAEVPRATDEGKTRDIDGPIEPIAAGTSRGLVQKLSAGGKTVEVVKIAVGFLILSTGLYMFWLAF